ncbi:RNA polymerase sigma-70 factor, ECF subfamily [Neorhodopirellula lusitana]|uniref:RNA polymerase sigma-70 factor, ECF subfamily n=1 Tax=Neorhodopirellula lusitana TaxID=445327 RepID=A0ABY1Q871_9BACT|nr:sigma-70 family RNA polymerase sigma factor [Neorhodopirellula lusitana]SMP61985.1 RNA polymerase sigma-70 factor, ECF subfamily [Neorhodopirellula lusitana]
MPSHIPSPDRTEEFLCLLTEHEPRLARYATLLIPHLQDSDEVLQEAKLVMWRSFDRFETGTDFGAWARKVVFHQVLKFRRRPSRRLQPFPEETLELLASEIVGLEKELDYRQTALAVCIAKLPDDHRRMISLRYFDENPIEQIATQLGRKTDAVYQSLSRIRRSLHRCISDAIQVQGRSV